MKSTNKQKNARVIRRAFTMRLKPGSFAKYKHYHDNIWPELVREIEACGIAQITTFENDMQLFLYSEIYDGKAWDKLWSSKIHDKWAECMGPLMQFRADGKVDAGPLREIFHLETAATEHGRPAGAGRRASSPPITPAVETTAAQHSRDGRVPGKPAKKSKPKA